MILLPPLWWFNKIKDYGAKLIPIAASILGFFAWFYNIVAVVFVQGVLLITNGLNGLQFAGGGADFSAWPYIGLVNAMFPLSESLAILSAYFTFWATLITIRWAKSFIPTISN